MTPACIPDSFAPVPYNWIDLNQDGYIVFEEYYYFMSRMDPQPPFDMAQAWWSADDNHDNILTPYEHWQRLFPPGVILRQRRY